MKKPEMSLLSFNAPDVRFGGWRKSEILIMYGERCVQLAWA